MFDRRFANDEMRVDWYGEDQRANIVKTRVLESIGLRDYWYLLYTQIEDIIGRTYVSG